MPSPTTRRRFLRALSGTALATGLAGCLDGDDGPTPTERTTATETGTTGTPAETTEETTTETSGPTDVTFPSAGDATVSGTLFGGESCGVVLVPQANRDRKSWFPQARVLSAKGYTVLPIDEGEQPPAAVLGAMRFLRAEHGVERVVLVGAGSGGTAVVKANAQAEAGTVAGLIALSPGGGQERASELQGQTLFVVSEGDGQQFVETTRTLHANAPEPTRLLSLSGDAHGQRIFESAQGDRLRSATLALVENACEKETTTATTNETVTRGTKTNETARPETTAES